MFLLENQWLKVAIRPVGAEYAHIIRKDTGLEYLWQGDPAWWDRSSPVLFPFVGISRGGHYSYQGREYPMAVHGFAKDKVFEKVDEGENFITLRLTDDEQSRSVYPFRFSLDITYRLEDKTLCCDYEVKNRTDGEMYFSLGAHPGIRMPLLPGESWADYFIEFEKEETADTWCFRNGGVQWQTLPCLEHTRVLDITPHMFDEDALIFKGLASRTVSFTGRSNGHRVTMDFHRFPTIAFWAAGPNAPFICMEPWFGHADMIDHDGQLPHKVGVQRLEPEESFSTGYRLALD